MAGNTTTLTSSVDQDKDVGQPEDQKDQVLESNALGSEEKTDSPVAMQFEKKYSTELKRNQDSSDKKMGLEDGSRSLAESYRERRSTSMNNIQILGLNQNLATQLRDAYTAVTL